MDQVREEMVYRTFVFKVLQTPSLPKEIDEQVQIGHKEC